MERDPDNRPIITPNNITDYELLSNDLESNPEQMGELLVNSKDNIIDKLGNKTNISEIVDFGWFYSDVYKESFVSEFDRIIIDICQGVELDSNTIIRRMATALAKGTNSTVGSSEMIVAEINTRSMVTKALLFSESEIVEEKLVSLRKDFRRRWNSINPNWETIQKSYSNSKQVKSHNRTSCLQSILSMLGITLIVILLVVYISNI